MLDLPDPPREMIFMLQREMVERLAAAPGTKEYGALSVRTQLRYTVKIEKLVPPEVFFPPPEVESAVVSFRLHDRAPEPEILRLLPGVVKTVFAQRRKQLGKVLSSNYGRERSLAALEALHLPTEIRPDKLTVQQYIELTRQLFPAR